MIDVEKYREQVKGPGKFEGEPPETAYFWDQMLNGEGDDCSRYVQTDYNDDPIFDDEPLFSGDCFMVDSDEADAFDLEVGSYVVLWTDSQGFTMLKSGLESRESVDTWIAKYAG